MTQSPLSDRIDYNAIIATLIESQLDDLINFAGKTAKAAGKAVRNSLGFTYEEYLRRATAHYGHVRTFFIQEESRPLYEYYIPLGLRSRRLELPDVSAKDLESKSRGGL